MHDIKKYPQRVLISWGEERIWLDSRMGRNLSFLSWCKPGGKGSWRYKACADCLGPHAPLQKDGSPALYTLVIDWCWI